MILPNSGVAKKKLVAVFIKNQINQTVNKFLYIFNLLDAVVAFLKEI